MTEVTSVDTVLARIKAREAVDDLVVEKVLQQVNNKIENTTFDNHNRQWCVTLDWVLWGLTLNDSTRFAILRAIKDAGWWNVELRITGNTLSISGQIKPEGSIPRTPMCGVKD